MMGLSVLIIGGLCISMALAAVVAVLVVWMQNRQESAANPDHTHDSDPLPLPGAGSPNPPSFETIHSAEAAELEAQVRALVLAGKKLEAIKVYRAATGVGLAEAKNAVEALERGEPVSLPEASRQPGAPPDEARLRALAASGNKIEAIKVYREITGSDLATAKNAVEAVQRGEPIDIASTQQPPVNAGDTEARIRAELAAGRKIEAIKIHRAAFGSSLQEAKEAVEDIERVMKA